VTLEPLTMGMSGDLAYTVYIEKSQVRVAGRDGAELAERISNLRPMALRVTHIFRREEGAWKIIHRHADAIMEKIEATAVLQQ
jgi:ketosteroid isomerase-like protein